MIAYLTVIGVVIAFLLDNENKNNFATYHIRQSLGLTVVGLGLFIIGLLPILGWIISFFGSFFLMVLWIIGLVNAINNNTKPVPILGKYFEDRFKNIQ